MALTFEQKQQILNSMQEFAEALEAGTLEAGVFRFGGVKIKVDGIKSDDEGASVRIKVTARDKHAEDVAEILNFINDELDGDGPIAFEDISPSTPDKITDVFKVDYTRATDNFDFS